MKQLMSLFCLGALLFASDAFGARRHYVCDLDGESIEVHAKLTVKEGDAVDRISGPLQVETAGAEINGTFSGFYDSITNNLVLFLTIEGAKKKKAVTGIYNSDSDTFNLHVRFAKKQSADLVCERKKKPDDLLTGNWTVNDSSFFSVSITESPDGAITGKGLGSFKTYTIDGDHGEDDSVLITFSSPDGEDETNYVLKVCGSRTTMIGVTDDLISPTAIWCRKNRAINQECQQDLTCPQ